MNDAINMANAKIIFKASNASSIFFNLTVSLVWLIKNLIAKKTIAVNA